MIVLLVSSIFVCVSVNGVSGASLENAVHVKDETELRNAINNASNNKSTTISLDNDITLTDKIVIPKNKDITLTSNKVAGYYKLIGADSVSTIFVEGKGVLKLEGIIVTHDSKELAGPELGGGVYVEADGQLIMYSGEISGNNAIDWGAPYQKSANGGGVFNLGVFEMYGGKISGNSATGMGSRGGGDGGGVRNSGTFTMFGGEISNNDGQVSGGGVANTGNFIMSGGKIINNHAGYWGGGVSTFGVFERLGGVISGNTAGVSGDNVHPDDGGNGGSSNGSGGNGGSSNGGDGGVNSGQNNGDSSGEWGVFGLRDVVFIGVGVAVVVVGVVVAVLLFTYKKELEFIKGKSEVNEI